MKEGPKGRCRCLSFKPLAVGLIEDLLCQVLSTIGLVVETLLLYLAVWCLGYRALCGIGTYGFLWLETSKCDAQPPVHDLSGSAVYAGVNMGSVLQSGSVAASPTKAAMYSAYSVSAAGILSGSRQGSMFSSGDALRLRTSHMRGAPL